MAPNTDLTSDGVFVALERKRTNTWDVEALVLVLVIFAVEDCVTFTRGTQVILDRERVGVSGEEKQNTEDLEHVRDGLNKYEGKKNTKKEKLFRWASLLGLVRLESDRKVGYVVRCVNRGWVFECALLTGYCKSTKKESLTNVVWNTEFWPTQNES